MILIVPSLHAVSNTHSLSSAVSRGNELYNMNSTSASLVTIVRNYSHCVPCAAYSNCGYYLRAAFISLRPSDCAATIQGQQLFEGGIYLNKYGIHNFKGRKTDKSFFAHGPVVE